MLVAMPDADASILCARVRRSRAGRPGGVAAELLDDRERIVRSGRLIGGRSEVHSDGTLTEMFERFILEGELTPIPDPVEPSPIE